MKRILHYNLLVFFVLLWLKAAIVEINSTGNLFIATMGLPALQQCMIHELYILFPGVELLIVWLLLIRQTRVTSFYISAAFLVLKGLFILWLFNTRADIIFYSWSGLVTAVNVRVQVGLQFGAAGLSLIAAQFTDTRIVGKLS